MIGVYTVLRLAGTRLWLTAHPLGLAAQSVAHAVKFGRHRFVALFATAQVIFEVAVI